MGAKIGEDGDSIAKSMRGNEMKMKTTKVEDQHYN